MTRRPREGAGTPALAGEPERRGGLHRPDERELDATREEPDARLERRVGPRRPREE
jgi:hypothetical protein